MTNRSRSPIVVVPEGLAANSQGRALPVPSFVYRSVLDAVAAEATTEDTIYLAPGNCFDSGVTEQEAGGEYLKSRSNASIIVPCTPCVDYIDTRGNARLLREFLEQEGQWPMGPVRLYVVWLHAKRASICFRKEGFRLSQVRPVSYRIPHDEQVVGRLWYYRNPLWYRVYEIGATVVDVLRPGNDSIVSKKVNWHPEISN